MNQTPDKAPINQTDSQPKEFVGQKEAADFSKDVVKTTLVWTLAGALTGVIRKACNLLKK